MESTNDGNSSLGDGQSTPDNGRTLSGAISSMVSAPTINPDGTIDTQTDGVERSILDFDPETVSNFSKEPDHPEENANESTQLKPGLELVASYLFMAKKNAKTQFDKISQSANGSIWKFWLDFDRGDEWAGQTLLGSGEQAFLHKNISYVKVKAYVNELFPGKFVPFNWTDEYAEAATPEIDLNACGPCELVDPPGVRTTDIIPGHTIKVRIGKIKLERPSTWHHLSVEFEWHKEKVAEEVEIEE